VPPAKVDLPAVRRLWSDGLSDAAIARRLGWDPETVRKNRRLLGLPNRTDRRAQIRDQIAGGLLAVRDKAVTTARTDLATMYGLPAHLAAVQVAVVVALAGGPLTAEVLADRTGRSPSARTHYHRFQCPSADGGNHLTALRRSGLVIYVAATRGAGNGSGRGAGCYTLSASAMDLLTAKKEADRAAHAHS
jgi:hypothetical protein